MTDEMIRSMKAQMEPSDDVVAELLSMIAAESSSPVTPNDNLVAFRKPVEDRLVSDSSAGKKAKNAKKIKKINMVLRHSHCGQPNPFYIHVCTVRRIRQCIRWKCAQKYI